MENISRVQASSYPELLPSPTSHSGRREDYSLEGIATNVKLLLKLIQDHHEASTRDFDERRTQRIARMMTILEDVKLRIEKSQSVGRRLAELRRCNTDLRPNLVPRDKRPPEAMMDEKARLRRQIHSSLAAQKSLALMCSSLEKEKEIIAPELARKVNELEGMEELVNDLKVQNETLLAKLQAHATKQERKYGAREAQGNVALQEHNKELSEQLLRSLDSYRSLKRKYKVAKDENAEIRETMEEIGVVAASKLDRIRSFSKRMVSGSNQPVDIEEQISVLEQLFEHLDMKISRQGDTNLDCAKPIPEISTNKPSVLA